MRTILLIILLAVAVALNAFGQAGPGRKDPPKKKRPAKAAVDTAKLVADTLPSPTKVPMSRVKEFERATKTKPAKSPEPPPTRSAASHYVPRAILCAAIENREPAGAIDSVVAGVDTVFFFTEIVGLQGTTVTHRWKQGAEVRAEVPIAIGGPRWRVYSRKVLLPEWAGRWTVEVVDADTRVLVRKEFVYQRLDG
jgi:hypothetical protein